MKKLLVFSLIFFSFLFQSCSSYKSIDYDNVRADKEKKFRVVMLDNMKIKGRLVKKDEQNIYLATWDGKTLKIPKEGIDKLKVKKFSYLKTGGYIGMTSLGLYGIYLFLDGIGASMY